MSRLLVRLAVLAAFLGSVPLLASPSHAVEPVGGCWVWYAGTPERDISSKLAPWANPQAAPAGPADHTIALSPAGPPAGSTGTITYTYNKGPENAGPAAQVKGTFRFSVNGGNVVTATVDYGTISTGQTIPGKTLTVPFEVLEGRNDVVFEGVTFDASPFSVKIDCNGQTAGDANTNPRKNPVPTNVKASLTSSGTASGPGTPTTPGPGSGLCLPALPLPLPNPLPCPDEGSGSDPGGPAEGGSSGGGSGGSGEEPEAEGTGTGSSGGSGAGGSSGVPGSPATGTVDFDCVLQPFDEDFDYKPATSVGGARPSPGAPVGVLASFGDLPGIAPVPINGPMEVTADLVVGGKPVTVTGKSDVQVPPETPVPVPDLTGSVDAAEDTLPVTVSSFGFHFPSFDITGTCKPASGQDLGEMQVGSGSIGGGSDAGSGPATTSGASAPTGSDPASAAAEAAGEVASGSQEISVVDVRLEGSRTIGELFGAAPQRTLVLVVQNVGDTVVEKPVVAVAMGRSDGLTPAPMDVAVGALAPQQMQRIEVPMAMPRAGIGTYHLAGQVGTSANGTFGTTSQTYPWGLFVLNVVALVLFTWGVRRRMRDRRTPLTPAGRDAGRREDDAEATIDLSVLDRWFARPRRGRPGLA